MKKNDSLKELMGVSVVGRSISKDLFEIGI
jgi:hypothetical protein